MDLPHFTVCSSYFYILSMRRPLVFRVPDFWSKAMRDRSRSWYFAMFGLVAIYWRNMNTIHRELGPCFPALCLQSASFGFGLIFPRCRTTSKQFVPLPAAANTRTTQSLRAASCFPLCQAGRFTASVSNRLEDFSGASQDRMNVKQCQTLLAGLLGSVQNATWGVVLRLNKNGFLLGHVAFCL